MISIRPAREADLEEMRSIYNEAVEKTNATFDIEERTEQGMILWFRDKGETYPVIIAETEGRVAGWASLSKWSEKKAYDTTAEVSVYVRERFRKRGIGKRLIEIITLEGGSSGFHSLLARITQGNEISMHLFESYGYVHFGTMKEAGKKFGKFWDVHFLQRIFPENG